MIFRGFFDEAHEYPGTLEIMPQWLELVRHPETDWSNWPGADRYLIPIYWVQGLAVDHAPHHRVRFKQMSAPLWVPFHTAEGDEADRIYGTVKKLLGP